MKKTLKTLLATFVCLFVAATGFAQSPIGIWITIDDNDQKPRSEVEIYEEDGKLYGRVLKIFPRPDDNAENICEKCDEDDPRYMQPVEGMQIIRDLKQDGDEWNGGKILDPANGEEYKCYITLESEDRLKLRGYIGFSLLGRTQYWNRKKS
ncbi:DUF2147 domain-containing protein [Pontibacter sp. G13]|uniref:DUF2147 domain-containing protein n=1 Tax=Pontibacter sp. G13 TaxID=3074898 RepID=UPI00288C53ED|nr:DUF2147 domain-containing protein [Pontibacter sp. G13]WNJ16198.1 DUF2147 domain-containing protein [Pontibacter sp. G13]